MRQTASKGEQIQPSSCISHFLNNGVFTLLIIIRSGIGKSKFTESRLPNQRSISLIDLRDTINWRLARKKAVYLVARQVHQASGLQDAFYHQKYKQ